MQKQSMPRHRKTQVVHVKQQLRSYMKVCILCTAKLEGVRSAISMHLICLSGAVDQVCDVDEVHRGK